MTTPTDRQIEAMRNEYLNRCGHYRPPSDETFAAILTAAAEARDATIERCAQMCDDLASRLIEIDDGGRIIALRNAAKHIRALKDKP